MWITFCANSSELLYVCRQKDLFCFQSYLIFLCLNVFVSVKSVKKIYIYKIFLPQNTFWIIIFITNCF